MDESLRRIFVEIFGIPPSAYSDSLSYEDTREWDSLGHLDMVMAIQEEFGVEFEVDEVMDMENVGKIKEILQKKLERVS